MKPIIHRKPTFRIPNSTLALSPSNVLPIILSLFFLSQTSINKAPIQNSKLNIQNSLELVIQNGHNAAINGIQLTKDEKKLISYSADNTIKIWETETGKLFRTLEGHTGRVDGIQLTEDEKKLISYSNDETIKIWELETGKLFRTLKGHTGFLKGIRLTKDEKKLISYSNDKTIKIWETETGKLFRALEGHTSIVDGIQLTKDEKKLISYSMDNTIKIWEIESGKLLRTLEGHTDWVNGIQLTKDERELISYSQDNTIKIWEMDTGNLVSTLEGHTAAVNGIQLTKDEKNLISCSYPDGTIKIWGMETGKLLNTFIGHTKWTNGIQLTKFISYSDDKTIKIWELEKGKLLKSLEGHTAAVKRIRLTKDEKKLISYSEDNTIKIWEIGTGKLLRTLEGQTQSLRGIELTRDEEKLISYSDDGAIKIWEMETGKLLRTLEGHTGYVRGTELTNNQKKIISYSYDGAIKIWNTETGKLLQFLEGHTKFILGLQLTRDENKLISNSYDETIKIWELETGKLLKSLEGHTKYVKGIQLTKDEKKLISYSDDKTIKIWQMETGKLLKSLEGHTESVYGIRLTRDENKLISYSRDKTIKIWEMEMGNLLRTLEGHTDYVGRIRLTKDEKKLISYSYDGAIKIWEMETGKLLRTLEGHTGLIDTVIGIHLTRDEKKLISYSDKTIKIWELETGKLLLSLEGHTGGEIQLTKDENKIISYSDKTIKIWNMETGMLLTTLKGHTDYIYGIQLINDEKKLISTSADNTIKIWDISEVKTHSRASLLQTLNHQSSSIINYTLQSTPAYPNMLLSFSSDGSLRYWDMDTGKLLLTQLLFKEGESIYYTADGYFDFTGKKVMDYIAYTSPSIQSGFIDLQDLWEDYKRDDLKESVLAGRFKPKKGSNLIRSVETTPVIKTLFDPQKTIAPDKDNYPMRIQVSEKGSRLGSVVVFVNGVQVVNTKLSEESTEKDMEIKEEESSGGKSFQLKFPVPLNYGTNRVEIKAYNEFGIPQSYPAFDLERKTPANLVLPKPNLFVLSVGVNEYQKNKLKFSVKDAEAMAEVLSKNGKELYSSIHVKKLLDKDATKKGIEDALADIARYAKPEDVVLIYLSGHGNNASSREVKSLFYFVPFDFNWSSDSQAEYVAREQGIDAEYLNETFTKIKSHKVILILDACHSGSIQTAMLSKGEDETKASRKAMDRMANGTGRFIFASSAGNELSREHSDAGHGLYTYVLLNALGKNTDKKIPNADYINADGFIYLSEIRSYIEQKFEDQTEKYLTGVRQSPPSMSLGRNGMHERVNDFPLLKVK